MWFTYVIQSLKDKKWYTRCTNDLKKRLKMHNEGKVDSTQNRKPFRLIYCEICFNREDAFARERYLKSGMGKRYLHNRLRKFLTG